MGWGSVPWDFWSRLANAAMGQQFSESQGETIWYRGWRNLLGWLLRVERFLGDGGFRDCHWAIVIEDTRLLIYPIFLPFLILSLVLAPLTKFLKTVVPSFSVLLAWRVYTNMLLRREYDYFGI